MSTTPAKTIRAAGGIVSGVGSNRGKIAVVRRRRYGEEVGLPKGKLNELQTPRTPQAPTKDQKKPGGLRRAKFFRSHTYRNGRPWGGLATPVVTKVVGGRHGDDNRSKAEIQWRASELVPVSGDRP